MNSPDPPRPRRASLALAGLALLLIVALGLWWRSPAGGEAGLQDGGIAALEVPEDHTLGAPTESPEAQLPSALLAATDARDAVGAGVRLAGEGRLVGRAKLREDGSPVAQARVELLAVPPAGAPLLERLLRLARAPGSFAGRARPVAVTETDAVGRFAFEGVRRGKYFVDVRSEFCAPEAPQQVTVLASGAGGPVDVWMKLSGSVSGEVLDAEGDRLRGVRVMLEPGPNLIFESLRRGEYLRLEATSDEEGRFEFSGVPPGSGYELTAYATGIAVSHSDSFDVTAGEVVEVALRARRGGTVIGRVLSVELDEDGLPAGQAPIAGAHVGAIPRGLRDMRFLQEILEQTHCITEEDGSYRMTHVPPGDVDVVAYAPQHLLGGGVIAVVAEGQTSNALPIELSRGALLSGRVVDGDGDPIAGVHVRWQTFDFRAMAQRGMQFSFSPMLSQAVEGFAFPETAADGRFVAGPFPGDAPHSIHFYREDFAETMRTWDPEADAAEIEVVMQRGGSLEGLVMDLDAAEPIPAFSISTIDRVETDGAAPGRYNPFGQGEHFEDAGGRFRLPALCPGPVRLTFHAEGYVSKTLPEVEIEEGAERKGLIVTLSRGALVRGRVVDLDGEPVAGVNVMALDPEKRMGRRLYDPRGDLAAPPPEIPDFREVVPPALFSAAVGLGVLGDHAVRTDPNGAFELRGLPAGRTAIVAFHPAYASTIEADLLLEAGEERDGLVLELSTGASVFGTVEDRHGEPIPASMVIALSPSGFGRGGAAQAGGGFYQTQTDAAGEYSIEHMEAGSYLLVSTLGDEALNPLSFLSSLDFDLVTVPPDERVRFDIIDESRGATRVFGRVLDRGAPVGGGSISAVSFEGENFLGVDWKLGRIDGAGNYEFEGLAPAEYQFEMRSGAVRTRIRVEVPDQPEYRLDLELPVGSVAGRVVDAATGVGVRRARVFLRPLDEDPPEGLVASFLQSEGQLLRSSSSDDGGFLFEHLPAGRYELLARPRGGDGAAALAASEPQVLEVGESERLSGVLIELPPSLALSGRLVDESGQPVEGARVLCTREGAALDARPARARSDADGRFELTGLSDGAHVLTASRSGFAAERRGGIEPDGAEEEEIVLTLRRGTSVELRVYGADGRPLAGASARFQRTDQPGAETADPGGAVVDLFTGKQTTDAEGRLELGRFVPGIYELEVWRGPLRRLRPSVQVEAGDDVLELRVDL